MAQKDNSHIDFVKIEQTEEFQNLQSRKYKFVYTIPILFFFYYSTFPILSAYANSLMAKIVFGNMTFGYFFGISYYVVIWALAGLYVWKARSYDRQIEDIIEKYGPKEKGA